MSELPPLRLDPVLVPKPWGGRRLADFGKALPPDEMIGESWEVADLTEAPGSAVDDPRSRVAGGPLAGAALGDLVDRFGADLLGSAAPTAEGRFPLLVKFLDAREHLSVQVHPTEEYVARHPEARLKTESWYVIDAAPDAELFLDAVPGTTREQLGPVLGSPQIVPLLQRVPASAGDFHHLPAGLLHALGAGVLVAEVQTPSDTTFRVYDWTDEYGRPERDMHVTQAAETVMIAPTGAAGLPRQRRPGVRTLVVTDQYWIREHVSAGGDVDLLRDAELRVLMVTRGRVTVDGAVLDAGGTMVLPAAAMPGVAVAAEDGAGVLEVGVVPLEAVLATIG
ncbi:MAG TPA: type I phosphomannose isomerase catalytic subunit [Euzebyales bacterium]|nr:type I phosphomannose isomerase catalytic subunit [Euzebyales bacterium]